MFEVGDRVVCVDVYRTPGTRQHMLGIQPLEKGRVYTVLNIARVFAEPGFTICGDRSRVHVFVEVPNFSAFGRDIGWRPSRFRKLRDISQSLSELKELALNCPALVES